jgi:hypothetical protein
MARRIDSAGPQHRSLTEWAKSQGVEINDVAPTKFPGRGVGIAALRKINVHEPEELAACSLFDKEGNGLALVILLTCRTRLEKQSSRFQQQRC